MVDFEQLPLPLTVQWQEHRGWERVYHGLPENQSRFLKALVGFRQTFVEYQSPSPEEQETVDAIETVIRAFATRYPDFMESHHVEELHMNYVADGALVRMVREIQGREQSGN